MASKQKGITLALIAANNQRKPKPQKKRGIKK